MSISSCTSTLRLTVSSRRVMHLPRHSLSQIWKCRQERDQLYPRRTVRHQPDRQAGYQQRSSTILPIWSLQCLWIPKGRQGSLQQHNLWIPHGTSFSDWRRCSRQVQEAIQRYHPYLFIQGQWVQSRFFPSGRFDDLCEFTVSQRVSEADNLGRLGIGPYCVHLWFGQS